MPVTAVSQADLVSELNLACVDTQMDITVQLSVQRYAAYIEGSAPNRAPNWNDTTATMLASMGEKVRQFARPRAAERAATVLEEAAASAI